MRCSALGGDARVFAWLQQEHDGCFTSAVVIAQLAYWVRSKEGCQRRDLQVVTGNDKDFRRPGLKVFNPFKELPPV